MLKKGYVSLVVVLMVFALVLSGCTPAAAPEETSSVTEQSTPKEDPKEEATESTNTEQIVLKLGHGVQETHPTHAAALKFKELIEEGSEGRVVVEIYPNKQLGEERDMVEGLQLGTVDFVITSTGPLGGFVQSIGVVDLPFLFNSSEHAYKVLDSEIGQGILDQFESVGLTGLSFMENGWRHLSTAGKKVTVPEDLKGMKIRTMENEVHMASFQALGAAPEPMVWGEVYTSLQQGVIDGQENPAVILATNALWEVQDYYALTGHFYSPHVFLASSKTVSELPQDIQDLIYGSVKEVTDLQRTLSQEQEAGYLDQLVEEGMEVYEVDKKLFQDATKSVYDKYQDVFGKDLIDSIKNIG